MKKIFSRFDKTLINELPIVNFEGRIIVIQSESDAEKAVDYLLSQPVIGFDTETRPAFKRGQHFLVSLLQVSSLDTCFLFRLNHIGLPDCIIRLLTDTQVTKIGLSWHDDINMLHRRADFEPGTFVELQKMVGDYGIKDLSLQKLYANIFGQKISKSQRLSNWEADVLSEGQKRYAATDAWACVMLYEELLRMKAEGYDLEVVPEPEPVVPQRPEGEAEKEPAQEKAAKERAKKKKSNKRKYYHRKKKTSDSAKSDNKE